MSRRYRLEQEKAQQLTHDLQEEEDKIKLQKERIFGPIIWRRISEGIRIQDLKSIHYQHVLNMILENYPREAVLFKNSNFLKDPMSVSSFRDKLLFNMKDQCSIVAVDEAHEDVIVGALILKTIKKSEYGRVFSGTQVGDGQCFQSIAAFLNHVNKNGDVFAHFQCEIYLRYYLVCIKPEYRRKNIGFELMDTGLNIAKHLGINVVMGIFDCFKLQILARKLGMETLYEQEYISWIDKMGELKFCDPGAGNYSCALMAGEVITSTPEEIQNVPSEISEISTIRTTRAEKRKAIKNKPRS